MLLFVRCSWFVVRFWLSVVCCSLFVVCCLLFVCCSLFVGRCSLSFVSWLLCVVACCLLCLVLFVLFVVECLVVIGCSLCVVAFRASWCVASCSWFVVCGLLVCCSLHDVRYSLFVV